MSNWFLLFFTGLACVVIGGLAVANPEFISVGIAFFLAISFMVLGVVAVITAFTSTTGWGIFWTVILGILMVVTGFFLWQNPLTGVVAIGLILGILLIASGSVMVIVGFAPDLGWYRLWFFIGAAASFVLAYYVIRVPDVSLGLIFGIQLIIDGITLAIMSFSSRRSSYLF